MVRKQISINVQGNAKQFFFLLSVSCQEANIISTKYNHHFKIYSLTCDLWLELMIWHHLTEVYYHIFWVTTQAIVLFLKIWLVLCNTYYNHISSGMFPMCICSKVMSVDKVTLYYWKKLIKTFYWGGKYLQFLIFYLTASFLFMSQF